MFGYLTAKQEMLPAEEMLRYKGYYCGLCHSLKKLHGTVGRITLTYDMTFLVVLLSSLYEPEETSDEMRCITHPAKKQLVIRNEISDYAADMNAALAYLKCLDNWEDDKNPAAFAEAQALKKAYSEASTRYPRQCKAMEESIAELSRLEKAGIEDPDAASATFGKLMAEIFVYKDDFWNRYLRLFGESLGRFIYLLDAMTDLEDDIKKNHYNPFKKKSGIANNADYFETILKMTLGDAIKAMDMLPLVQDIEILQNILCFGIWEEFNKIYRKGTADVSGSI